jgi:hypothetical protein
MAFPRLILLPDGSPFASEAELRYTAEPARSALSAFATGSRRFLQWSITWRSRSRSVSLPAHRHFGFLAWQGLLASHVTGNLIVLAVNIADNLSELVMKLLALLILAAFVACSV